MWQVIKEMQKSSGDFKASSILLTTHSMEEAEQLSSRIGIMVKKGQMCCIGSGTLIKAKYAKYFEVEV